METWLSFEENSKFRTRPHVKYTKRSRGLIVVGSLVSHVVEAFQLAVLEDARVPRRVRSGHL